MVGNPRGGDCFSFVINPEATCQGRRSLWSDRANVHVTRFGFDADSAWLC